MTVLKQVQDLDLGRKGIELLLRPSEGQAASLGEKTRWKMEAARRKVRDNSRKSGVV
jgi:hypothetical protein